MSTGPDDERAIPHDTAQVSTAPWVMPGGYTVRLIANGNTISQPLKIAMDPRVKTSTVDLEQQFTLAKSIYDDLMRATAALHEISVLREQLEARSKQPAIRNAGPSIDSKLDAIAGSEHERGVGRGPAGPPTLGSVRMRLARIEHSIESADEAPTTGQKEAYDITVKPLAGLIEQWRALKHTDLQSLNEQLKRSHLAVLSLDTSKIDHDVEDQLEMGEEE
jgi:hypothetical protein